MYYVIELCVAVHTDPSGSSLAGIAGSNPTGGFVVCLFCLVCVVR